MRSGEILAADLIVLATGYEGQEHLVGKLFGARWRAGRPDLGFLGEGQELRNMFMARRSRALVVVHRRSLPNAASTQISRPADQGVRVGLLGAPRRCGRACDGDPAAVRETAQVQLRAKP